MGRVYYVTALLILALSVQPTVGVRASGLSVVPTDIVFSDVELIQTQNNRIIEFDDLFSFQGIQQINIAFDDAGNIISGFFDYSLFGSTTIFHPEDYGGGFVFGSVISGDFQENRWEMLFSLDACGGTFGPSADPGQLVPLEVCDADLIGVIIEGALAAGPVFPDANFVPESSTVFARFIEPVPLPASAILMIACFVPLYLIRRASSRRPAILCPAGV